MDIATALLLLGRRSPADRAAALPVLGDAPRTRPDAWPVAATAAVDLAGYLDDARTDADLDEGLAHFQSLLYGGVVTRDQWAETIVEVSRAARRRENDAPGLRRTAV